jgi:L-iditol 2-dehydrogenase
MKALVLEKIGKLEYKEIDKPTPQKGEVLVAVKACGICGSDIPRAYRDGAHNMPLVIGHEFSGCVESVGEGVSSTWIGKNVGVFPLIPCRKCRPCLNRQYEMCRHYDYLGSRSNGGFAEYVVVPEWNLIELPEGVSYEAAAMIEPMAVAVHAMSRTLSGSAGAVFDQSESGHSLKIAVCGLGTIGTFLVMFLIDAGYRDILVIGNKEFQRKTMKELGIPDGNYCDSNIEDAYDFIMKHTDGAGADVFFECVGSNEVASLAVNAAAPVGQVCFVGNPHSDMEFDKDVYWKILRNQLRITGTWNSSFLGNGNGNGEQSPVNGDEEDDWKYVIKRLAAGSISPEKLITQKYGLKEIHRGFELMRDKTEDYIKVMALVF